MKQDAGMLDLTVVLRPHKLRPFWILVSLPPSLRLCSFIARVCCMTEHLLFFQFLCEKEALGQKRDYIYI